MSYLFTSYAVIWLALFAYIVHLARKQKRMDEEIETLKKLVAERR